MHNLRSATHFFQIKKLSNFLTHLQDRDICLVNLKYILYTFHLTKANFSQYSRNNSNRYHVTISQRLAGPVSGPVTPSQDESNERRVPTAVSASHQTTTKSHILYTSHLTNNTWSYGNPRWTISLVVPDWEMFRPQLSFHIFCLNPSPLVPLLYTHKDWKRKWFQLSKYPPRAVVVTEIQSFPGIVWTPQPFRSVATVGVTLLLTTASQSSFSSLHIYTLETQRQC